MLYYNKYNGHSFGVTGKRKKYDDTIYCFDIETSSYLIYNNKQINACEYLNLSEEEQKESIKQSNMYIWQLSINDIVYYGRKWEELVELIKKIDNLEPSITKYIFVHNLAFEFQYLKNIFHFEDVQARKSHKVMTAKLRDYNIIFRCTYFMSNCSLAKLTDLYKLPIEKKVGDLNYDLVRHSETKLTEKELGYCEYDCLVLYYYIQQELKTYETLNKIPTTSTGKVRKELQAITRTDFSYRRRVNKAINVDPHVYNLLQQAFMGGYTHANWIYSDEVIENVDSFDETSAYPYVLVSCKYPGTEFKKCNLKDHKLMSDRLCYLLVVKFKNLKSKFFNNYLSASKCRNLKGCKYDNGRIIECEECEITITDIDFKLILDWYTGSYEIIECYYSSYSYLPLQFINFVLEKYVTKTKLKDVPESELEYSKEKNKFNALYGMSVTNTIRDNVIYDDETKEWKEEELTNDEIIEKLEEEKSKSFLSFAYGVWVTAYARDNLMRRVMDLDEYVIYCDTDSIKLKQGYDINIINKYNESIFKKIDYVSKALKIPIEKFSPEDIYGNFHMLGIFESETKKDHKYTYDKFITQGAKKYAIELDGEIKITVAGVPKSGSKALSKIDDFRDNFVFDHKYTNKNLLMYCDNQQEFELTDFEGKKLVVNDKSGCCVLPTTYVLSKSLEYANLLTENSSKRAIYKEGDESEK